MNKELHLNVPRLWLGVTTITVDTVDDEFGFAFSQKLPRCVRLIWEIDQHPVGPNTKEAGQSAFNDEDPEQLLALLTRFE